MSRTKWVRNAAGELVSSCGRFVIGGAIWTAGGSCYVRLRDTATGGEYPCRTEASAKAAARNISRTGRRG